jgi:hypothetical protein
MEVCPQCLSILKCKEGKYSSPIDSDKVIFTQLKICDNKQCENNGIVLETVEHEMN